MKKLIKLEFNNTTRERKTEDSYSELYSHDKNNGSFEFEILNETLTTEQVTALFKFTESNKIWKTTGTVEGNKVKVTFDTTLITQNETVICYLYFDEEQRTSDTFRFKFKVKVSEIDKISRYEVKERFINNTVIVDRLDVVTKTELQEALKNVGGIATEGLLTEVKAEEIYAKKSEAVDNTNFELVKNRVLALELKTDKDTVYDDSEVKERLTTLENKPPVDLSNYATKEELRNVSGSHPLADNLVTKEELENRHYISDVSNLATKDELNEVRNSQPTVDTSNLVTKQELEDKHFLTDQALNNYALKSELYNDSDLKARVEVLEQKTDKDTVYDDTPLKERVTALESKAIEGGAYDDKPIRDRLDVLEAKHDNDTIYDDTEVKHRLTELENKPAVDTSVFVTDEKLNSKGYLTSHQDLTPYALKSEIPQPYNDTPLTERVTALENRPTTGGSVDTSNLVTKTELKDYNYVTQDSLPIPLYKEYTSDDFNEYSKQDYASFLISNTRLRGKVFLNPNYAYTKVSPLVYIGDGENTKTAEYDAVLFTVASSLPDGYSVESLYENIDNKVTFLSNKNFSEVVPKEELKAIIKEVGGTGGNIDTSHFITDEILESKNYLTQHQPLDNLVTKEELNSKGYVTEETLNSKGYLTQHQPLTDYALKSELYNDTEVKERLTTLESRPNVDTSSFVTNEQLENKHYLTQHQELTHLATTSDLEALRNMAVSKSELNNKVDNNEFNTFKEKVVTKTELAEKGYLTTHQDLSEYALKSELYNDSNLQFRIGALEHDVRYNTDSIKRSVEDLEYKLRDYDSKISDLDSKTSDLATKDELRDYVKRTELPAPYDDTDLRNSLYSVENELMNKENEFNSRFVAKDDLRTLVTEIVSQLKSENN